MMVALLISSLLPLSLIRAGKTDLDDIVLVGVLADLRLVKHRVWKGLRGELLRPSARMDASDLP